jgi:hypothetical protein
MRYYPTLHLKEQWLVRKDMDVNEHEILSNVTLKGTVISKKGYGCKWRVETIQLQAYTQIKVKKQLVVRNDMDVNEHEILSNITLRHKLK